MASNRRSLHIPGESFIPARWRRSCDLSPFDEYIPTSSRSFDPIPEHHSQTARAAGIDVAVRQGKATSCPLPATGSGTTMTVEMRPAPLDPYPVLPKDPFAWIPPVVSEKERQSNRAREIAAIESGWYPRASSVVCSRSSSFSSSSSLRRSPKRSPRLTVQPVGFRRNPPKTMQRPQSMPSPTYTVRSRNFSRPLHSQWAPSPVPSSSTGSNSRISMSSSSSCGSRALIHAEPPALARHDSQLSRSSSSSSSRASVHAELHAAAFPPESSASHSPNIDLDPTPVDDRPSFTERPQCAPHISPDVSSHPPPVPPTSPLAKPASSTPLSNSVPPNSPPPSRILLTSHVAQRGSAAPPRPPRNPARLAGACGRPSPLATGEIVARSNEPFCC
ncbi:hypothetical protein FISHEDRAFT_75207 [Fistulina hepatica ATCC 64428]|uniref:Uncharacterized protein n=1 Tax=Fistulina hepatica ATCC 64428 TaxID=1128425 RepID=A0A0D7AAA8_9AGAR|nr:hypothetical protein FISHEDRAFT_75207 [Fistulina hepatica ATCC 64428]